MNAQIDVHLPLKNPSHPQRMGGILYALHRVNWFS